MIRVLVFGSLAAKVGAHSFEMGYAPGATVRAVVAEVERRAGGAIGVYMTAVNGEQAPPEATVCDGDEVAVMPPFSGG